MGEAIVEQGYEAGICGHDGTDWEKVLIDASKRLVVAVASIVAADVQAHGYTGGDWYKQPLIFSYSDRWVEQQDNPNAAAGNNNLNTTAVPSGYVYVLQAAMCLNTTTACYRLIRPYSSASPGPGLIDEAGVAAGTETQWSGELVLKEGDYINAYFSGCNAGDGIYLRVWGYMMAIAG